MKVLKSGINGNSLVVALCYIPEKRLSRYVFLVECDDGGLIIGNVYYILIPFNFDLIAKHPLQEVTASYPA